MVSLTNKACERMANFLLKQNSSVGVRLSVKTTGCSGLGYNMEFAYGVNKDDSTFVHNGVSIVIDAKSLVYLDGTQIDYVKEGVNEGFKFSNPNVKAECGCGESFTV